MAEYSWLKGASGIEFHIRSHCSLPARYECQKTQNDELDSSWFPSLSRDVCGFRGI